MDVWLQVSVQALRPTDVGPYVGLVGAHDQVQIALFLEPPTHTRPPDLDTVIEFADARGLRWRRFNDE